MTKVNTLPVKSDIGHMPGWYWCGVGDPYSSRMLFVSFCKTCRFSYETDDPSSHGSEAIPIEISRATGHCAALCTSRCVELPQDFGALLQRVQPTASSECCSIHKGPLQSQIFAIRELAQLETLRLISRRDVLSQIYPLLRLRYSYSYSYACASEECHQIPWPSALLRGLSHSPSESSRMLSLLSTSCHPTRPNSRPQSHWSTPPPERNGMVNRPEPCSATSQRDDRHQGYTRCAGRPNPEYSCREKAYSPEWPFETLK